ncbi:MAG: nicotinate-nicotinamide nucleotide adenylyltransferase [Planctomycetota bacterium]|nr:nicotinate-nicotinamide nucleotide adenylyltransferase [Planctomycetota bacterium]
MKAEAQETLLLFGGTFDPPHRFHVLGPMLVARRLYGPAGRVLFVPAARNPLKAEGPIATDEQRVEMLKLAIEDVAASLDPGSGQATQQASVWRGELLRAATGQPAVGPRGAAGPGGAAGLGGPAPSYTIDTVRTLLSGEASGRDLRLLIGSDQALAFHRWKEARTLIELSEPLVMLREPASTPEALLLGLEATQAWTRDELRAWCRRIAPSPIAPASSTAAREAIGQLSSGGGAGLWAASAALGDLTPSVLEYITKRELYRT